MNQPIPTCSYHGTLMLWKTGISKKTNEAYAFWSCPQKNPDGSYCKAKPVMPAIPPNHAQDTPQDVYNAPRDAQHPGIVPMSQNTLTNHLERARDLTEELNYELQLASDEIKKQNGGQV